MNNFPANGQTNKQTHARWNIPSLAEGTIASKSRSPLELMLQVGSARGGVGNRNTYKTKFADKW